MSCCLLSFALILAAARLGRGAGENTAEFRAACAIATQAQDIVEEPAPTEQGTLAKLLEKDKELKREDIAAALAAVAESTVKDPKEGVTEERKNATLLAARMLADGTWATSATLAHAVALAKQARHEWKQVAPLMVRAKKAANRGLYGLVNASDKNVEELKKVDVAWNISGKPKEQAIGADKTGNGQFTRASGQALAADITCLCPTAEQENECIKIQSEGNVIDDEVENTDTAIAAWKTLKKYCIAPIRGRATKGSILASIAHLKAMLGTNTAENTRGRDIPHITHALGQQGRPTSAKNGIKYVTYGAYDKEKIPWEQQLIDAGDALDKGRRLADHAERAADLALGLVTEWAPVQRNESEQAARRPGRETDGTEQQRDKEKTKERGKENGSHRKQQECTQTGGTWNEGRCQRTAHHAESANAHTDNAHTIQTAMRAGMMLAALVVKTPA
ncbi:variant surface glycoprotein, (VSG), putative [Trypanosoma vivax Y486]|uniref:Variant surface glycoprotein, (VSG), putative n=1 Tax=Trypanosoma vivax (strain Y486) TaxID=1055687 RepID=F9WPR4_TRYVY|nr:variant surface glycoprotein, (VSG), putative [Trypanosoma vivax Y486]|eukprot:CCD19541.1 variant surface glycoprotein, (VSG), putative [Trypanosoma vivax Y486]